MSEQTTAYARVMATPAYAKMIRRRRRLVWPMMVTLFALLMALTALTVFTGVLDGQVTPGVSGALIAAYVVFFTPVVVAHVYVARVGGLDALARQAVVQAGEQRTGERA